MSHISTIKVKIRDLDALESACRELKVELRRNQKQFKTYNGALTPCDFAIVVPGERRAYEAGVVKAADGDGWELQVDNWNEGQGLNDRIGHDAVKLQQYYGIHAATAAATRQGMRVARTQLPDGSIRLVCEPKPQFAVAGAGGGWAGSGF
jgi:hypothetical protein